MKVSTDLVADVAKNRNKIANGNALFELMMVMWVEQNAGGAVGKLTVASDSIPNKKVSAIKAKFRKAATGRPVYCIDGRVWQSINSAEKEVGFRLAQLHDPANQFYSRDKLIFSLKPFSTKDRNAFDSFK